MMEKAADFEVRRDKEISHQHGSVFIKTMRKHRRGRQKVRYQSRHAEQHSIGITLGCHERLQANLRIPLSKQPHSLVTNGRVSLEAERISVSRWGQCSDWSIGELHATTSGQNEAELNDAGLLCRRLDSGAVELV